METGAGATIAQRLTRLRENIATMARDTGRDVREIRLIAVSKTRPLADVEQALAAGQCDFGENTVQDALSKIPLLANHSAQWHFIGHLQSKKAKYIAGNFQWIHSIDSLKLAQKLSRAMQAAAVQQPLNALIQVNVSGEASKSGLAPSAVRAFIDELLQQDLPQLQWRGLMTIGVKGDQHATRAAFARLRSLQQNISEEFALPGFDQLSMGMSGDYTAAIAEGATMIRIGTAIFGPRQG